MLGDVNKAVETGRKWQGSVTSRFAARITDELIFAAIWQHRFALILDAACRVGLDWDFVLAECPRRMNTLEEALQC